MYAHGPLLNLAVAAGLPAPRYVCVAGGFRAGTNYLRYLLEANYRCQVHYNAYGWKHAPLPIRERRRRLAVLRPPVVGIAKNPFAYMVSLHKYYTERDSNIRAGQSWDAFLEEPFIIFNKRYSGLSPRQYFANPVQYWNAINWSLAFVPEHFAQSAMLTHDRVILDPEGEVRRAAEKLGLRARGGSFRQPQGYMKRLGNKGYDKEDMVDHENASPDRSAITEKQYLEPFSEAQQRFVASQADAELLARLGLEGEEYGS